jgi:hypothetical protein
MQERERTKGKMNAKQNNAILYGCGGNPTSAQGNCCSSPNYLPYITLVIMLLELRCTVYGENNEIVKPLKGCKVFLQFCQQCS